MKPWIVYCRISDEDQSTVSLDAQRDSCTSYLRALSITDFEVITDDGFSAYAKNNMKRPGIQRIMQLSAQRAIAGVIVWHIDRISRWLRDLLHLVDLLKEHDVAFASVILQINTTGPFGEFLLQLFGALGQLESRRTSERVKLAMAHRLKDGGFVGGPVPSATLVIGEAGKRRLVADPVWKTIAANAWKMAADGSNLTEILTWVTANGLPCPQNTSRARTNGTWHRGSLHYWLTNPKMVGLLVDKQTFTKAGAMLSSRSNPRNRSGTRAAVSTRVWPLKGLAKCGHCGAALIGFSSAGRSGAPHYYLRCSTKQKSRAACDCPDLPAVECEKVVIDVVVDALRDGHEIIEQLSDMVAKARTQVAGSEERMAKLVMQRDALKQKLGRIVDLVAEGGLAADAARDRLAEYQTDVVKLDRSISEIEGQRAAATMGQMDAEIVVAHLRQGVERLQTAPPDELARGLAVLVKEVRITASDIEVLIWPPLPVGLYQRSKWRNVLDDVQTAVRVHRRLSLTRQGRSRQMVMAIAVRSNGRAALPVLGAT